MELQNMEQRRNTGTLAEQRNTGRTSGIPRNSGRCEEQRNNLITKQHQEILPMMSKTLAQV